MIAYHKVVSCSRKLEEILLEYKQSLISLFFSS